MRPIDSVIYDLTQLEADFAFPTTSVDRKFLLAEVRTSCGLMGMHSTWEVLEYFLGMGMADSAHRVIRALLDAYAPRASVLDFEALTLEKALSVER